MRLGRVFHGAVASPGIAIGPAFLLHVEELRVSRKRIGEGEEAVRAELERFRQAVELTRQELIGVSEKADQLVVGRELFEVHLLLVQDPALIASVERMIEEQRVNAEFAVGSVLRDAVSRFESIADPYLRERSADVRDVGRRIVEKLLGTERQALDREAGPFVLIAGDLDPSDTAGLTRDIVLGFATEKGGATSHTAILARSLGIPAVVGLTGLTDDVNPRDTVIIDGIHGKVVVRPDEGELLFYRELKRKFDSIEESLCSLAGEPAVTSDGHEIELAANIEFSQEADHVRQYGGKGVGLFRTEFLRLLSPSADEESQYSAYVHVLEVLRPDPVIIRTFDLGGDKFFPDSGISEANPFLGWRSVRVCLDRPEMLRSQLRAILRASTHGNARVMFPMITDLEQVLRLREILDSVRAGLDDEGVPVAGDIPFGIMIETPAAAISIDLLVEHVDFVSIGTNDLTQYTLAVDRGSKLVAKLFDPFHPAVLRQIRDVVRVVHEAGKWVGVCGELAGNPLAVPILLGLGVDELSVATMLIPEVKRMIRVISMSDARMVAEKALRLPSGAEIRHLVHSSVAGRYPQILLEEEETE
ncbi:phosphoenolpyruvate--protein phosphotransferase [Candidatus Fermentibacterales bacterium]|nr:phosphoenolpyruvate--protein phosphotransferase [Candidatus Fermentibacterales bacterium]